MTRRSGTRHLARRAALLTVSSALMLSAVFATGGAPWASIHHAAAQDPTVAPPDITVEVTATPEQVTVGDRVTLTVAVTHPAELLITLQPPPRVPSFIVIDEGEPVTAVLDQEATGGRVASTRFVLTTAAFATGSVTPPPLDVLWLAEDGRSGALRVPLPTLGVTPTLAPGATTLRPLKPQAGAGTAPPYWGRPRVLGGAATLFVLLGVAALAVRWARGRRRETAALPQPPDRAPELRARAALDAIDQAATLRAAPVANGADGAAFEAYYGEIASVVRRYLAQRYGPVAAALTTSELGERMTDFGVERWQARLVSGLLERCDAAVYAGRYPDPASADHDLTVAYEIVQLGDPLGETPAVQPDQIGASE